MSRLPFMQIFRIILACLSVCAVLGCAGEPKDAGLIKNFQDHRQEFEALRVMIIHDQGLHRVDADWTDPADPSTIGITPGRIAEYRAIFRKLGIPRGFSNYSGSIELLAHCEGIAVSGSSEGYCWLASPPEKLVSSLDEFRAKQSDEYGKFLEHKPNSWQKHGNAYRHIEGNWYLHYDS
jgi:hypothetical protein